MSHVGVTLTIGCMDEYLLSNIGHAGWLLLVSLVVNQHQVLDWFPSLSLSTTTTTPCVVYILNFYWSSKCSCNDLYHVQLVICIIYLEIIINVR